MLKKVCLLATLLMILIFPAVTKAAADWVWVASDKYQTIWIDNNSIGRDSNGFFAYFKWTFSDAGLNRIIESRRKDGLSVSGFYNLSYAIWFNYFKSSGRTKHLSIMGSIYYDKNDRILDSYSTDSFYWDRIIPDTLGEAEYDAAYARVRGK